jgi:transcription elongation factor SPT6
MTIEDLKQERFKLYQEKFEPSEVYDMYLTPFDEVIKETDIPERLQLKCPNRASPDDQEILEEAEFIYNTGFTSLQDQIEKDDLIERISNVLRFLWKDHFEIPFIATYRKDHWYTGRLPVKGKEDQITEEPANLLQHHLWEIYDWDEKYKR